ncbi:amino acid ABC transporter permease [Prochlorococcus sp. MIT 1300]|uniref:amino acid ABC transporter permease n=1 Tax=Prochlorococcus sp. MIT 1300 TaxID=3096218 RepID=UPI002A75DE1D|nr:amino acid ABC transporter permease [Prochlorococcus sp. MIT 1300]
MNILKSIKKNLLSSPVDILISTCIISMGIYIFNRTIGWISNRADWSVVYENIDLFAFGSYPASERYRPLLWIIAILVLTLFTLNSKRTEKTSKALTIAWLLFLPIGLFIISGGIFLTPVATSAWGGLTLTLVLTLCSCAISLPLGICLALGRQSKGYFINNLSRIYIDTMRSFPLITVLFFGQLLIPLFLPIDLDINRVLRAIIAFAFFASAYIAEDIRGALQAIPKTQEEASIALGLTKRQTLSWIILPQALIIAIPALTNQAIGLLQNTSLMAILGLVELLGVSRSLLANPDYIGNYLEVYVFLAIVYWMAGLVLSLLARHLEKQFSH